MNKNSTAGILIGYQNDYFASDGILTGVIEESSKNNHVVENTLDLLRTVDLSMFITTPIIFSDDYSELADPVGILKTITEVGAFKKGTTGSETIPELEEFKDKITEIPGKDFQRSKKTARLLFPKNRHEKPPGLLKAHLKNRPYPPLKRFLPFPKSHNTLKMRQH